MRDLRAEAKDFCERTNTIIKIKYVKCDDKCVWDKGNHHDKYKVTITRTDEDDVTEEMILDYWSSIVDTCKHVRPDEYDILACIEKYDPYNFEDFCDNYGYEKYDWDNDGYNKESMKIFKAVEKQYEDVERVFRDVMEELRGIA